MIMVKGNKEKKFSSVEMLPSQLSIWLKQFFMAALNAFMDLISVVTLSIKLF